MRRALTMTAMLITLTAVFGAWPGTPATATSCFPRLRVGDALGFRPASNPYGEDLENQGVEYVSDELPAIGVYEETPLASAPGWFVVGRTAARTVVRYWGAPPEALGEIAVQRRGGALSGTDGSCYPGPDRPAYLAVLTPPADGGPPTTWLLGTGEGGELSDSDRALLTEHFGPPTEVDVGFWDRTWAQSKMWGWRMLLLVLFPGVPLWVAVLWVRLRRRLKPQAASTF